MAVEDLVKTVMDELKNIAQSEVHVGKPMEIGSAHVIPISKISMGFGAGGGGGSKNGDKGEGRGTGGGLMVEPLAFLVVQDDDVQLLNLQAPGSPAGRLAELIPELIDQIRQRWAESQSESDE